MHFLENVSLKRLNTFKVEAFARYYVQCTFPDQIPEIFQRWAVDDPWLIMGGGSNLLFTRNFDGLVIQIGFPGKKIVDRDDHFVLIEVNAGENWDTLVEWTVENNFGGLENLSLIPGTVGASPVQNIGAYGVEAGNAVESVTFYSIPEKTVKTIPGHACRFSYRSSIFKNELAGKAVILSVRFRLQLNPLLNTSYRGVKEELEKYATQDIRSVREAIIAIRRRKLPDPEQIGNAGSFFKNPVVSRDEMGPLVRENPDIPFYPAGEGFVKIPAAWLIEKCGWKGYRKGDAGIHPFQPLVLVNYGQATGAEILDLALAIQKDVQKRFGILLEPEVRLV